MSVGNKFVTSAGNTFPAVVLSNLYVALYLFSINFHVPLNLTPAPFIVFVAAS